MHEPGMNVYGTPLSFQMGRNDHKSDNCVLSRTFTQVRELPANPKCGGDKQKQWISGS